jgi:hypothetical protein
MPPWEGFDELYHYGVVQHLATTGHFPEIGKTTLSRELWNSLDYLPVSHYIQPYLERPSISFEDYFRLTEDQRSTLRQRAESMDRAWRQVPSPRLNYEAKQAPLTYYLLAPLDAALAASPILTRVLALRVFVSLLTVVLSGGSTPARGLPGYAASRGWMPAGHFPQPNVLCGNLPRETMRSCSVAGVVPVGGCRIRERSRMET